MFRTRLRSGRAFAEGGFTLVELIITVAIIGILGGASAVGVSSLYGSAKDNEAITHLKAIVSAEAQSNVDAGQYTTLVLLTTNYKLPVDASVNSAIILGTNNSECFIATTTSTTGNKYVATDVMTDPKNVNDPGVPSLTSCSVTLAKAGLIAPANDQYAPSITTLTLAVGKSHNAYTSTVQTDPTKDTATSGTKLFSVSNGALPAGLTLDSTTGIVSGTPTVAGLFGVTIRVDNANGFDLKAYSLEIDMMVTTLAGSGTQAFADGTGTAASFSTPDGVAVDSSGNVYVADNNNNRIRKITSAGVVTTLAGSGTAGSANGTGTAAQFNGPQGVAVDSSGNVYVADFYNMSIRKITSAGVVTTLAGSGTQGLANGTGTAAQFSGPAGVAVDSSGTVYVTDAWGAGDVRKITPAGVVTTLAGSGTRGFADGTGTAAQFNDPNGVAVDSSGTVYVGDTNNSIIRKITPAGVVTTLAGSGAQGFADGTGTAAVFRLPMSVAVDSSGTVYVADYLNERIRKITPAGVVTTLAGSGTAGYADGVVTAAQFYYPYGVAVDSSGAVYVGDNGNNRIRKIQ